jgi:rRNA maturation protein Nop10
MPMCKIEVMDYLGRIQNCRPTALRARPTSFKERWTLNRYSKYRVSQKERLIFWEVIV